MNDGYNFLVRLKNTDKILSNAVFKSKIELSYETVVISKVVPNLLPGNSLKVMKRLSKSQCAMRKFKKMKIEVRYDCSGL